MPTLTTYVIVTEDWTAETERGYALLRGHVPADADDYLISAFVLVSTDGGRAVFAASLEVAAVVLARVEIVEEVA